MSFEDRITAARNLNRETAEQDSIREADNRRRAAARVEEFAQIVYDQASTEFAGLIAKDPWVKTFDFRALGHLQVYLQGSTAGVEGVKSDGEGGSYIEIVTSSGNARVGVDYAKTPYYDLFFRKFRECAERDGISVSDIRIKKTRYLKNGSEIRDKGTVGYYPITKFCYPRETDMLLSRWWHCTSYVPVWTMEYGK